MSALERRIWLWIGAAIGLPLGLMLAFWAVAFALWSIANLARLLP